MDLMGYGCLGLTLHPSITCGRHLYIILEIVFFSMYFMKMNRDTKITILEIITPIKTFYTNNIILSDFIACCELISVT
jgi:hypothetical protein